MVSGSAVAVARQERRPLGPAARLIAPLFLVVGALFATAGPSASGAARAALLAVAAACGLVGLATWRVDWTRLPDPVIGLLPWVGGVVVTAVALAAPEADGLAAILLGLVVMYCGVAFHRARFLAALVLGSAALTTATLARHPGPATIWQLLGTLLTTTAIGSSLHWLRGLMDADTAALVTSQTEVARHELEAEASRDRTARQAAEALRTQLEHRAELAAQVAEQSLALAPSSALGLASVVAGSAGVDGQ